MSQSARSAVFLQEMGIGVQWKARNAAVAVVAEEAEAADSFTAAVQALADEHSAAIAPPVAAPVAAPVVAPESAPAVPVIAEQPAPPAPVPAPVPVPAAIIAPPAPVVASASDDDSMAWFDDAPAPARAAPVSEEAIAAMDWAALQAAVASCTRCTLCETRRNAVTGRGAENATWIAISGAPSRLDEKDKQAVAGDAGQLLHNMLKAIELKPESDVYVTSVVKCRPSTPDGADRHPSADEVIACRPFLDRELALTGARMAMTFGQFAAKGLMMGPAARGKVMHYGEKQLPVVATYHPDDLLRKPEDKAKAWADLCLAKASHA
ncbi:uracil-DNA glycosylase [Pseudoduganella sp. FT55W]|uniref:Uracil-DNA glycosylase n=1 Tax=Duganella rivi TaxID=2666083 RepID=A0A7X4GRS1_9BURK|nr:uracil-DNA glycosylase [Duganella rivi]MYM68029.1 uracil-DNA glycosylase [Duganella rivi]